MTLWDQVSDVQRDAIVADLVGALEGSGVLHNLRPGLVRYFSDGILPGSFLQAVLVNDLMQAVIRADDGSAFRLADLVRFLIHHAPASAWGSRAAVLAWTTTPDRLEIL